MLPIATQLLHTQVTIFVCLFDSSIWTERYQFYCVRRSEAWLDAYFAVPASSARPSDRLQ